jgi:circadian clock protein KaiB
MYKFKLYVTKSNPKSNQYINDLQRILTKFLSHNYHLKIVNVLEQPDEDDQDNICMTPTLVKISPSPMRKIVGDISRLDMVMDRLI